MSVDETQDQCCENSAAAGRRQITQRAGQVHKGGQGDRKCSAARQIPFGLETHEPGPEQIVRQSRFASASPGRRSLGESGQRRKGPASSSRRLLFLPRQASLDKKWEALALEKTPPRRGCPAARGRRGAGGREAGAGRKAEAGVTRGAERGRAKAEAAGENPSLAENFNRFNEIGG